MSVSGAGSEPPADVAGVLAEQVDYYSAVAAEYEDHAIPGAREDGLSAALEAFAPTGRVLELAPGTGQWTRRLLRHADTVTAVDASAEMIAIASGRLADERVTFVHADIFDWTPEGRYDVVFFGFWLSHVPLERFESFWSLVGRCLTEGGRVFFVDDAYRTEDELAYGESSPIVRRRLNDGSAFDILKVPHTPAELEERLRDLGWQVSVTPDAGPLFWGAGRRRAQAP